MRLTSTAINTALDSYTAAKLNLQHTVKGVQTNCTHIHLAEWETSPPIRICLHCGLTEEGWGCGYIVLKNKTELGVPSIDEENFSLLRQGCFVKESDKGPLLRKETTLEELL